MIQSNQIHSICRPQNCAATGGPHRPPLNTIIHRVSGTFSGRFSGTFSGTTATFTGHFFEITAEKTIFPFPFTLNGI